VVVSWAQQMWRGRRCGGWLVARMVGRDGIGWVGCERMRRVLGGSGWVRCAGWGAAGGVVGGGVGVIA
jgi:hypothetical protein